MNLANISFLTFNPMPRCVNASSPVPGIPIKHCLSADVKWLDHLFIRVIMVAFLSGPALAQAAPPGNEVKIKLSPEIQAQTGESEIKMELPPEAQAQIREVVTQFAWASFASAKVSTQGETVLNQAIKREVAMRPTQNFISMEFYVDIPVDPKVQSEMNSQTKTIEGNMIVWFNFEEIRSIYPKVCNQTLPLLSEIDRAGVQTVCTKLISH